MAVGVVEKDLPDAAGVDLLAEGDLPLVELRFHGLDVGDGKGEMIGAAVDLAAGFGRELGVLDDVDLHAVVIKPGAAELKRRPLDLAEAEHVAIEGDALL